MSKMSISFILNDSKPEDETKHFTTASLSNVAIIPCHEKPAEETRPGDKNSFLKSENWRSFSSPRLSEAGTENESREDPNLSSSGRFLHCAIRKNRRLKYISMIEEEKEEESRLQERVTWLIRRIGMQKVSQVLSERLPDSLPVIEGSAKDTIVLERPRRDSSSRGATNLSEEQRASRRNMQKRESKRRLFKYYQDQLDAIRQNIRRLREATKICEVLFDEIIERNIHRLRQSGLATKEDAPRTEQVNIQNEQVP